MSRIKNLLILEHFTNNQFSEPYTFGKYWFDFEGRESRKLLVIRQNDEWKVVSNILDKSLKDCLDDIRKDVIDELKLEIEKQLNKC